MARKSKTAEQPDAFAGKYPNIASWVRNGWVEIGRAGQMRSFVRALDDGGMVFEGKGSYRTMDDALQALDAGIAKWVKQNG